MTETRAESLVVITFGERPDLLPKVFEPEIHSAVPEFMRHDPTSALYYGDGNLERYLEYGLVAVDPAAPDRPVARAFSVPFAFPDGARGRETLPDGGWDQVIRWGHQDRLGGIAATAVSALEIMVAPFLQGRRIAGVMLAALRDNARRLGFTELYAPLRPTDKHREPLTPFAEYWPAGARTGCRTIPGYAPISASAPGSSRLRRAAWWSPAPSPNGANGPGLA